MPPVQNSLSQTSASLSSSSSSSSQSPGVIQNSLPSNFSLSASTLRQEHSSIAALAQVASTLFREIEPDLTASNPLPEKRRGSHKKKGKALRWLASLLWCKKIKK